MGPAGSTASTVAGCCGADVNDVTKATLAINEILDLQAGVTTCGRWVKCYTPDSDDPGLCKTYLEAAECQALADAFGALATALRGPLVATSTEER